MFTTYKIEQHTDPYSPHDRILNKWFCSCTVTDPNVFGKEKVFSKYLQRDGTWKTACAYNNAEGELELTGWFDTREEIEKLLAEQGISVPCSVPNEETQNA